jgi:Ca2+-binding EF-hand superfamily protein
MGPQTIFQMIDDDESNKISFRNLKRVSKEAGMACDDEDVQATESA